MTVLYPRLLPGEASKLFDEVGRRATGTHGAMVANHSPRAVYAATGGRRVTREELDDLRESIIATAREQGFPEAPSSTQRNVFDQKTAQILHNQSLMNPGEAAQKQVWAFLALVLLPDICVWRWPANAEGKYYAERFKGMDLTRHALARLWTRAHVLHEPASPQPYGLLTVLGEADLDQIMSRRGSVAATPALVRAVVRDQRETHGSATGNTASRPVLRETLMRLLRLSAFMDMDALSEPDLSHLVRMQRVEAARALE